MDKLKSLVVRWDWKESPPWDKITRFCESIQSPPFFTGITTEEDDYAVVITDRIVTYDVAYELYKKITQTT